MKAEEIGAVLAFLIAAGTGTAGSAQQIVVPKGQGVHADLAVNEGNHSFHLPARYAPSRVLAVYRGTDLGVGTGGFRIGSLAFRRDGLRTFTHRAHQWKLTVHMSAKGVTIPSRVGAESFDAAHGSDRITVVDGKLVDWPAAPKPVNPPAPFSVSVKLDKPFLLPQGANLCVDMRSDAPSNQRESVYWYVDAEQLDRGPESGGTRILGRGCPFEFATRATVPPLDGESRIETRSFTRVTARTGAWAFLVVGTSNQAWGARTLPIDLPGAAGCRLYTNPMFVTAARTVPNDSRGFVRFWSSPLPKSTALEGLTFYQQVLVEDRQANALGLRSSNYLEIRLGKVASPLPARLIYDSGPDLTDVPTASVDSGIVLRLSQ